MNNTFYSSKRFIALNLLLYLILSLFVLSQKALAELTLEITSGADEPVRMGIVPFQWTGKGLYPVDIAAIVRNDLSNSGLFNANAPAPENMLSFPTPGNLSSFRDWRASGSDYLLIGRIQPNAETSNTEAYVELYQVSTEQRILQRSFAAKPEDSRLLAHSISDAVYEHLTGIPGAFTTRILYVTDKPDANGESRYRLMLADQDGARERLITESSEPLMSPSWSPDGTEIAYVSFETGRSAIFKQVLATGEREQLTAFKGINGSPVWSPDGSKMAMVLSKGGNPDIYIMNMETRVLTQVTRHYTIDTEPNWSRDGESIVFTSDRGGRPQIYRKHLSNGKIERLTFEGDYNARPRLTPDGRYLVMVHRNDGVYHIAVQDLQDTQFRIVSRTDMDESPTVSPNGAMVMYATKRDGRGILAGVSLDAGIKFELPPQSGDVREPAWSPN